MVNTRQQLFSLPKYRCINPIVQQGINGCQYWRYGHCLDDERDNKYRCRIQHQFSHQNLRDG
jgi:hypothetical protein